MTNNTITTNEQNTGVPASRGEEVLKIASNWTARGIVTGVVLTLGILGAAVLAGCGTGAIAGEKEAICDKSHGVTNYTVIGFSSTSDLNTAREYAPKVIEDVLPRVAKSCGTLAVAVATNRPQDLKLQLHSMKPAEETANNAKTQRKVLTKKAKQFAKKHLLDELATTKPTAGSPFLATIAAVTGEAAANPVFKGTLVLIGDAQSIEASPVEGKPRIDFRKDVPQSALDDFKLKGGPSCVIIMGAGQGASSDSRVIAARAMLKKTLNRAGIGFVDSSSTTVPAGCP
jgi:hypothetical protein